MAILIITDIHHLLLLLVRLTLFMSYFDRAIHGKTGPARLRISGTVIGVSLTLRFNHKSLFAASRLVRCHLMGVLIVGLTHSCFTIFLLTFYQIKI